MKFIKKPFNAILAKVLPTVTRIIRHANQEPPALAHTLSVDDVHDALRSAEAGDCTKLFGIYRDIIGSHSHLQAEFGKRKLAVINEPLTLIPKNPDNKAEVAFIKAVEDHINKLPDWDHQLSHFLDSTLYPVAVAEKIYQPSDKPGWRYQFQEINPVPHTHLAWPEGVLSRKETTSEGFFTGEDTPIMRREFIIHRGHLLSSVPDWWGGPMRALLFWWLFSVMDRDWWARFLDRFGAPFLEGQYDNGDDQSRYELERAFSFSTKLGGIVHSKESAIDMHQANTNNGGDAFQSFHNAANREMSKLIVGQTLSAEGQNLGLGGGQAAAQEGVRDDICKFDKNMLGSTIEGQILLPLWLVNSWTVPMPSVSFGADSEEADITGETLESLANAGLEPTDDALDTVSKRLGFAVQRSVSPLSFSALSANPSVNDTTFIPAAVRRLTSKRQARGATEKVIAAASPQLAAVLSQRGAAIQEAIELSSSPDDAANRIAALTADFDPSEAAEIVVNVLSACSSNALQAVDN